MKGKEVKKTDEEKEKISTTLEIEEYLKENN
jgi:hypothetical protein